MRVPLALDARDCEGHFPGRPIVPGVVLLARAAAVLETGGMPSSLNGIRNARLRQLVAPDDEIMLEARTDGDRIRVDLERNGVLVADAVFAVGAPSASSNGLHETVPGPARRTLDLDALLPHRPPMRCLHEVIDDSGEGIVCTASIPDACPLAATGDVAPVAMVEAAAQAAALWEALRRSRVARERLPRIGYLVSMRDVEWFEPGIKAERTFVVSATLTASIGALTQYAVRATYRGATLLRGSIGTMLVGKGDG